ncbi:MAG: winged helix-turn-helix domain-containing protein [Fidelibacterota bacterium]
MENIKQKLEIAKLVISDSRLKTLLGKEKVLVEEGNVYGEKISAEKFNQIVDEIFTTEVIRKRIMVLLEESPLTVKELSERTGFQPGQIFQNIVELQRNGLVDVERVEKNYPVYRRIKQE